MKYFYKISKIISSIVSNTIKQTNYYNIRVPKQTVRSYNIAPNTILTVEKKCYQDLKRGDIYAPNDPRYGDRYLTAFTILSKTDSNSFVFHLTENDDISPFISEQESALLEKEHLEVISAIKNDTLDTIDFNSQIKVGKRRFIYERLPYRKADRQLIISEKYQNWIANLKVNDRVTIEPIVESNWDKCVNCVVAEVTNTKIIVKAEHYNDSYKFYKTGMSVNRHRPFVLKPKHI